MLHIDVAISYSLNRNTLSFVQEVLATMPTCTRRTVVDYIGTTYAGRNFVGNVFHEVLLKLSYDPTSPRQAIAEGIMRLLMKHGANPLSRGGMHVEFLTLLAYAEKLALPYESRRIVVENVVVNGTPRYVTRLVRENTSCYAKLAKLIADYINHQYVPKLLKVYKAMMSLKIEDMRRCIEGNPETINIQDAFENTPLHRLVRLYSESAFTWSTGGVLDFATGRTAQRRQAICEIAELLLEKGADITIVNLANKTPLALAEELLGREAPLTQMLQNHATERTLIHSATVLADGTNEKEAESTRLIALTECRFGR